VLAALVMVGVWSVVSARAASAHATLLASSPRRGTRSRPHPPKFEADVPGGTGAGPAHGGARIV